MSVKTNKTVIYMSNNSIHESSFGMFILGERFEHSVFVPVGITTLLQGSSPTISLTRSYCKMHLCFWRTCCPFSSLSQVHYSGELQGFYLHMVTFSWPLFISPWLLYSIRNMWGLPVVTEILRFLSASVLLFDIICAPWVSCLASFLQACIFSWPWPLFFFFLVVECSWTSWHLDIHSKIIFHG